MNFLTSGEIWSSTPLTTSLTNTRSDGEYIDRWIVVSRAVCAFFISDWFKRNRVEDWRDRKGP